MSSYENQRRDEVRPELAGNARVRKTVDGEPPEIERRVQEAHRLESLGRCVGAVVHDFNNVLTAVMVYSDLIAAVAKPGSDVARYNDGIRDVAKRGAGVAGDLLRILRPRPSEPAVVDCNPLITSMSSMLQRMVGENVELCLDMAREECYIKIAPAQLQQIIFNLVLNARDAMPDGGRLTIRSRRGVEQCTGTVGIEVVDSGEGMSEETLKRAFDPFFTTKREGKGTGLGLTIVQKIVHDAGGDIEVTSKLGAGTSVSIMLPTTTAPMRVQPDESCASLPKGHETVLVVEDDLSVRSAIVSCLGGCGYRVIEAANGLEAVEILQSFGDNVDLLITDLILPGISGRELARRVKAVRPNTHVLFMSGYELPAEAYGGTEPLFEKPFSSQALAERVRQALGGAELLTGTVTREG